MFRAVAHPTLCLANELFSLCTRLTGQEARVRGDIETTDICSVCFLWTQHPVDALRAAGCCAPVSPHKPRRAILEASPVLFGEFPRNESTLSSTQLDRTVDLKRKNIEYIRCCPVKVIYQSPDRVTCPWRCTLLGIPLDMVLVHRLLNIWEQAPM